MHIPPRVRVGNTEGVLVNEPRPGVPGTRGNPPEEKSESGSGSWIAHAVLDVLGAIPLSV